MHRQLTGDQSFSNLICDKLIQLYVHVCEGYIQMHSNTEKVCQENTLLLKKQIRMYDVVSRGLFFATSSHFLVTYFWNSNRHFWFLYSHFLGLLLRACLASTCSINHRNYAIFIWLMDFKSNLSILSDGQSKWANNFE